MKSATRSMAREVRDGLKGQSRPYYFLVGVTLAILGLGLIMVASASSVDALLTSRSAFTPFRNQFLAVVLGFVAMLASLLLGWQKIARLATIAVWGAIGVQIFTVSFGVSVKGNKNWIEVAGYSVQPSEFLKIALIAFLAVKFNQLQDPDIAPKPIWLEVGVVSSISIALVAGAGEDLGTGIILGLIVLGMMLVSGVSLLLVSLPVLVAGIGAYLATVNSPNRMARIMVWLDPNSPDPLDLRWQTTHASWAFAEGGVLGTGLGQSKLKWNWIPEVENDFIFAVVGEELGLIGAITVVSLYIVLAIALMSVARLQTDFAARLFVSGVMLWIFLQALVNIGVVLGVFPVLGVTLPLMSQGGSSMVATLLAIGLVLGIERHRLLGEKAGRRR